MNDQSPFPATIRLMGAYVKYLATLGVIVLGCLYLGWLYWSLSNDPLFIEEMQKHLLAMVGIPGCVLTAFVIVILLEQASGPIEFEGLGFKFKGSSGQIVMWLLTFLALVAALKSLW